MESLVLEKQIEKSDGRPALGRVTWLTQLLLKNKNQIKADRPTDLQYSGLYISGTSLAKLLQLYTAAI